MLDQRFPVSRRDYENVPPSTPLIDAARNYSIVAFRFAPRLAKSFDPRNDERARRGLGAADVRRSRSGFATGRKVPTSHLTILITKDIWL